MVLTLSLTGCGRKAEETPKESAPPQNNVETTEAPQSETQIEQGTDVGLTGETVGKILLMDFERYIQENPDVSAQEMADHILANSIIQFSGTTMAVEEGLLAGFNNAEITGFDEGYKPNWINEFKKRGINLSFP